MLKVVFYSGRYFYWRCEIEGYEYEFKKLLKIRLRIYMNNLSIEINYWIGKCKLDIL